MVGVSSWDNSRVCLTQHDLGPPSRRLGFRYRAPMLRRRPPLPSALSEAWWAFLSCAEVIEQGRRRLLATLPAGRVEPVPVEVGLDAVARAIDAARAEMWRWRLPELVAVWSRCFTALEAAAEAVPGAYRVSASATELEDLLVSVEAVVEPLGAFGDAERVWRRRWRVPIEGSARPNERSRRSSRVDDTP